MAQKGLIGTWKHTEGSKGGFEHSRDTAADAGTQRRVHRREVEAGEWWVRTMSRWTEFRAERGGGEPVQEIGDMTTNATDGGAGR